jgi:hypothetical protein
LVEQIGDLPPQTKKSLRNQLNAFLRTLGLTSPKDLGLVYQYLSDQTKNMLVPQKYPNKERFREQMLNVIAAVSAYEKISTVPRRPVASDLAQHARFNPLEIQRRGNVSLENYLYNLGILMSNKLVYTTVFAEDDAIEVGRGFQVENGRHRAFTLRCLGRPYVSQVRMDDYITVKKIS